MFKEIVSRLSRCAIRFRLNGDYQHGQIGFFLMYGFQCAIDGRAKLIASSETKGSGKKFFFKLLLKLIDGDGLAVLIAKIKFCRLATATKEFWCGVAA